MRARVPGFPLADVVLEDAALSPIFARPEGLRALSLADDVEDNADDEGFVKSLKYATSTLYYSMAGVFSGGSRTEQVGDMRASVSGFVITQRDRDYYREMGDKLRGEVGAEVEPAGVDSGGMFDASGLAGGRRNLMSLRALGTLRTLD